MFCLDAQVENIMIVREGMAGGTWEGFFLLIFFFYSTRSSSKANPNEDVKTRSTLLLGAGERSDQRKGKFREESCPGTLPLKDFTSQAEKTQTSQRMG